MSTIPVQNLLAQSPNLYLQGAGSDGNDGTATGIHLRWDMLGELGESHIPKGNLASSPSSPYYTTSGFNKADDFVKIYRTVYNQSYPIVIDFATMQPSEIIDIQGEKVWRFENIIPVSGSPATSRNVIIRFTNITQYNRIKQLYNPLTDSLSFLENYKHVIEAEVEGLLMFSAKLYMQVNDDRKTNIARIESISLTENNGSNEVFISNRKKFVTDTGLIIKENLGLLLQENDNGLELEEAGSGSRQIIAENIKYIRFKGDNCYPSMLWLETYDDFIAGKNSVSEWEEVTQLALSIDDNEVFTRLEKPGDYAIDNQWPRFNGDDKVKVSNYQNKWSAAIGLKYGVLEYLTLSTNPANPQAINPPEVIDPEAEVQEGFSFSYLPMLKLTAFDFHIARMLGFGYIDTEVANLSDSYIYTAVYETTNPATAIGVKTHTYTTLPVGKANSKLPVAPQLKNLRYGMFVENGTDTPTLITDINGYSLYDDSRTVNLDIVPFETDKTFEGFFLKDEEFSYVDRTKPIMYGVEYKNSLAAHWQRPAINVDETYIDDNGLPEIVAITGKNETELYTHTETNEGIHVYAVYGINWFSRSSVLSNSIATDETIFPVRNTLIPPLNFGVQLIQEENPLIFTTQAEQIRLNALSGDKTLVRLTFDWNNIHAASYWYGNQAAFFFRNTALNFVRGRIKSVTHLNNVGVFELRTEGYTIFSRSPASVVMPYIAPGTEINYINSLCSIDNDQFLVESIVQSTEPGEGPIFTVKGPGQTAVLDTDLDNQLLTVDHIPVPVAGKNFAIAENTSLSSSWSVALQAKVALKKFSNHQETVIQEEGNKIINVGGIFEKASIVEFEDKDDSGNFITGSKTGLYEITFDSYILEPHEDPKVEWYKGSVRLTAPDGIRPLEVWNINLNTATLKLIVYDTTFDVNKNYEAQNGYIPISTGTNLDVNFHPGYRVYLEAEAGFNESSILPEAGDGERRSFMACLAEDTVEGLQSYLSAPAILLAREIIKPVQPEKPIGPAFATRPDFYGKATYTFDTKINTMGNTREPYALVFYRADERIILENLYKSDTVAQIIADLDAIEDDEGYNSRWNELANGIVDELTGAFKIWNGYGFPNPDNDEFKIPNPNPSQAPIFPFNETIVPGSESLVAGTAAIFGTDKTYHEIVQLAINNIFIPLTEQPVIYKYLKNNVYQTSPKKPVIRDREGNLLIPGSLDYDAAPMAVKFVDGPDKIVRFTDYTLDGASNAIYFYYTIEMNDTLSLSERSEITGPIQLIDTSSPKAPEFRKFYTQPNNFITGDTASVIFEINDYPQSEGVNKILIYRTFNIEDALSVQTMQLAGVISVNEPMIDDFSDLEFLPYGEVLYYRLVAVRTIKNEFNEAEDVFSLPSTLVLANIIDTINPTAPSLSYTVGPASTDELLEDVTLNWEQTVYNGTYYLCQMNSVGNWEKIDTIKTNAPEIQYQLPNDLVKVDEDGDERYYRFKVSVENSSGLTNLEEKDLTI
ncbi:hypothetical protein [Pedobacter glucosidilyticus]|uniref:hypothetical protein n=1 Tax=Pedobacter glucosidilyticus TaxID=1122941 RepID=UPI0004050249|nr:hypothetical protein [Pedobacter glucosidilyticus]